MWSRLPTWPIGGHAVHVDLAHLARGQLDLDVVAFLGHELGGRRPRSAPSARPCRAAARCCGSWCPRGSASGAGSCRAGCPRPRRRGRSARPSCPRGRGCSASRRPRSGGGRGGPSGSGRIRSPPPWRGRSACRGGSPRSGSGACGRRPGTRWRCGPRLLRPPVRFLGSVKAFSGVVLRDLLEGEGGHEAPARRGGVELLECHLVPSGLLEELDHLFVLLQDDVGLLPVRPLARRSGPAASACRARCSRGRPRPSCRRAAPPPS